ncbi:MAG: LptA/OstA family protein [Amphiplicatus sp.]
MRSPLAAGMAALICGTASAQLVPDSEAPVDITGDSLEVVNDVATWVGNVRAIQGEAILTSDKLIATFNDNNEFTSLKAIGRVRYSNGKEAITGESALYDSGARSITVTDNVVITQGKTVMSGGFLVYWIDTGQMRFSSPGGRRIRGIFHTKSTDLEL